MVSIEKPVKVRIALVALTAILATAPLAAAPAPLSELVQQVAIPYQQFTLTNGLRVVVHTDRKAPVVHVGVWYGVGSIDEPVGKSGFAHLFEHLMFYGSEHHLGNHFQPLEEIGATDFNGTTSFDRTNYFQTVPTPALDLALFLESDRMGFLLPALDQRKLDAQRNVVLNEKRQGDNQPGGLVRYEMLKQLFPADHPMSISAIGRVEDIEAATLNDARHWFRSHYGPNNAVLVLAGDIDIDTAKPMVEKWFGEIPSGPTPGRFRIWVPNHDETRRVTMHDTVPTTRLSRFWAVPGRNSGTELANLQIAMAVLGGGATSRLYERLVRDERLAVSAGASASGEQHAGIASISAELAPDVDQARLEQRVDEILADFLQNGPTDDEVARVAMRVASGTIRGLEKVGGFGGKGVALAEGLLYTGDPGYIRQELQYFANATPATVLAAARKWLSKGDFRLALEPGTRSPREVPLPPSARIPASSEQPAQRHALGPPAPRASLPAAGPATDFQLPQLQRARLSNGIEVVFARQTAVPVVRIMLSMPGGIPADNREKPGTQTMLLGLLGEGSNGALGQMDGPAIARLEERLGANVRASSSLDRSRYSLNALTPNLAESVSLFADILMHPTFPEDQLERVRVQALTSLRREASSPSGMAMQILPALLYGPAHPYGYSFSGSGTETGLNAVTRDDLIAYHQQQFTSNDAQIFAVGDTSLETLLPMLERAFGSLRGRPSATAAPDAPAPVTAGRGRIAFLDRPGAEQSLIVAAAPTSLSGRDDILAIGLANDIFGGLTSARLNQELREAKNWSYGAYSSLSPTRLLMPFMISAPVETRATGESIATIRQMLSDFEGKAPPTSVEIENARANLIRSLPGDFETGGALVSALERQMNLDRPDDYLEKLPGLLAAVDAKTVATAPLPKVEDLLWIVVGDRTTVLPQLEKLGLPIDERTLP